MKGKTTEFIKFIICCLLFLFFLMVSGYSAWVGNDIIFVTSSIILLFIVFSKNISQFILKYKIVKIGNIIKIVQDSSIPNEQKQEILDNIRYATGISENTENALMELFNKWKKEDE